MPPYPLAGLGPQVKPGPPVWSTYVTVDDADQAVATATAAGGQVVAAVTTVLDAGRMAVLADPLGAGFTVWEPHQHQGAGIVNEPGTLIWNELVTTDIEQSAAFYHQLLGWVAATDSHGPGAYTEFGMGGRSVAGVMEKPPSMPADLPPHWTVYFAVADADEAAGRAGKLGGSVEVPPTDIMPGRFAVVRDPQGARFSLLASSPTGG